MKVVDDMNKRSKLIVSIVGITIVLLALLGLTYAYYLTRIQGNTNTNSISVTTAKLELVYGDNSAEIISSHSALVPDSDNPIGTKTFTVTNNGNDSSYVVIIDNVSITKASDGTNTSFVSNDFRYTLSCAKSDGTNCNEVNDLTTFPINGGILVGNNINEGEVHSYTLTLWYIDTGIDQSNDMGKSYQARVNITDVNQMENPYSTGVQTTNEKTLAYNIIKNAKENKNGTMFVNTPPTKVGDELSSWEWGKGIYSMMFPFTKTDINDYYIAYADDFSIEPNTMNITLGTESNPATIMDTKYVYSLELANTLAGKYVYLSKEPITKTDGIWGIIRLSTNLNDFTNNSVRYEQTKYWKSTESVISSTLDDYGTSYYYRGGVKDNYVNFAGMCWRIVRIQGDGSIKIVLEDQYAPCNDSLDTDYEGNQDFSYTRSWKNEQVNFGYKIVDNNIIASYLEPETNSSNSMVKAIYNFQTTSKIKDYLSYLKPGDWCYNNIIEHDGVLYDAGTIFDGPYQSFPLFNSSTLGTNSSLKCYGTLLNKFKTVPNVSVETDMYVGTITIDEMVFAGGKIGVDSGVSGFYLDIYELMWLLSLDMLDYYDYKYTTYAYTFDGYLVGYDVDTTYYFVPSVILKPGTKISSGDGTQLNPYVVE